MENSKISNYFPVGEETPTAKTEGEPAKAPDLFHVVDLSLEIIKERQRTQEALNSRDFVVKRLTETTASLRQKVAALEHMQTASGPLDSRVSTTSSASGDPKELQEDVIHLEATIEELKNEIRVLKSSTSGNSGSSEPPPYSGTRTPGSEYGLFPTGLESTPREGTRSTDLTGAPQYLPGFPALSSSLEGSGSAKSQIDDQNRRILHGPVAPAEPTDLMNARFSILASIPLPNEPPDDTLKPILIPSPFTLHEFLSNATGALRNSLSNYRVLQSVTTLWCPDREEHGLLYTPVFKCSTNPRVATAHRWILVDVIGRMNRPTDCFFDKDGTWYYAGIYTAFRLEDLSIKEWADLSNETVQAIVKDTLAGRRNVSPQNIYETSQLYAAGALKVACVGLQCVGFDHAMYKAILDQAERFSQTKWKGVATNVGGQTVSPGVGALGPGTMWNSNSMIGNPYGELVDGMASLNLGSKHNDGAENVPIDTTGRSKK